MKFTKIPVDTFKQIQLNAGILVDNFDPATGTIGSILGATSGGISFSATPSFTDFAEDIDNAAKNMMEFKKLDQWEVTMSGTFAGISDDLAKSLSAASDLLGVIYVLTTDTAVKPGKRYYTRSGEAGSYTYTPVENPTTDDISTYYIKGKSAVRIIPRNDVLTKDFQTLWWVGDYSDFNGETNGGFCAIKMLNALSTGGFQIQSGDKAKGQLAFTYMAHYSNENPETVPFEIHLKQGSAEPTT